MLVAACGEAAKFFKPYQVKPALLQSYFLRVLLGTADYSAACIVVDRGSSQSVGVIDRKIHIPQFWSHVYCIIVL